MKLKNKISGEIKDFSLLDGKELQGGATLKSLTEEWEDYEEPKEYFCVSCYCEGGIANFNRLEPEAEMETFNKSIGNYFETREEAEKAVEKLKAWKRLKDKGFRFNGWDGTQIGSNISYISEIYYEGCADDMDLLFGGGK